MNIETTTKLLPKNTKFNKEEHQVGACEVKSPHFGDVAVNDDSHSYENFRMVHFGSVLLYNSQNSDLELANILIEDSMSYEEAVGRAYLETQTNYPDSEGWQIVQLYIEDLLLWVDESDLEEYNQSLQNETEEKTEEETEN